MKMATKERNWPKCSTMLKEDQLEKCRFRMRKKTLVKMKKELKSNKFSEAAKISKMKNRMMNMKWERTKKETKT